MLLKQVRRRKRRTCGLQSVGAVTQSVAALGSPLPECPYDAAALPNSLLSLAIVLLQALVKAGPFRLTPTST